MAGRTDQLCVTRVLPWENMSRIIYESGAFLALVLPLQYLSNSFYPLVSRVSCFLYFQFPNLPCTPPVLGFSENA